MEGYKQCHNGHYYKNTLNECPYCPRQKNNNANPAFDKTQVNTPGNDNYSDNMKTQVTGSGDFENTRVFGINQNKERDLSKTFIKEEFDDGDTPIVNIRKARKLTGWLVSYTIEPMGIDFRIFEGTNTVGRDPENTITITDDMSVSGKHISILCKKDKFFIKDEMAANGTFLNAEELTIGQPYELHDGDQIILGTTVFKFRASI